jgi:putative DNA primase/helicase
MNYQKNRSSATSNDDLPVRFAEGRGRNLGKAGNKTLEWGKFRKLFEKPTRTKESFKTYVAMSHEEQVKLKSIDGWIYRTHVVGASRNANSGKPTVLWSLDYDYATPELVDRIKMGLVAYGYEYLVHSSRRHTDEKPRIRFWGLFSRPVTNDEYGPLARIIARSIDPEMKQVDKVSFRPAQMMFKPTASEDGDWFYYHNAGAPADPDVIFADFEVTDGDWRDLSNLPRCEGEELREHASKAENPTTKKGPVGDFCRAYDVIEAIEKFDLPYEATDDNSEKPRFTYTGGTTTNGAVVEDGGLFLYSFHASDPCADRLVNAFDLVRIHKFGHLDDDQSKDTPPTGLPSWKAMIDFIADDPEFRRQQAESRYDQQAMFDDLMDDEPGDDDLQADLDELVGDPKAKRTDWQLGLECARDGSVTNTVANLALIIANDARISPCVEFNAFREQVVTRKPLKTRLAVVARISIRDRANGDVWQDQHTDALRILLEAPNGPKLPGWGLKPSDRDLQAAIGNAARLAPFHPVRERLEAVPWDKVPRVEMLFIDFLGAEDNAYHREAARKFMVAAVARAFEPGHKFDFVPIFEGMQGKRKSTFIRVLALDWFEELKGDFGDEKRLVEQMMGAWILELPELSVLRRSDIEEVKAFVSASHSTVRLSYGRLPRVFLRQCVFMGTTNQDSYLVDDTGNRRWWPVRCEVEEIDTDRLKEVVHQLWAEALHIYRQMRQDQPEGTLSLYLTDPEARRIAGEVQESRRTINDTDATAGMIQEWLDTPEDSEVFQIVAGEPKFRMATCVAQIWKEALGGNRVPTTTESRMIGKSLRKIGWETSRKAERFPGYGSTKVFKRTPADLARLKKQRQEDDFDGLV